MKERGILFSAPMVKALLAGTKTQTRRIVKPQPFGEHALSPAWGTSPDGFAFGSPGLWRENGPDYPDGPEDERRCPYGLVGDHLWVRETWHDDLDDKPIRKRYADGRVQGIDYRATHDCTAYEAGCPCDPDGDGKRSEWRPSIFMPRWASRITLEITDVRVERLHDISEEDAKAEGVTTEPQQGTLNGEPATLYPMTHKQAYAWLWDAINGKGSWASNPWVWCVSFGRVERST